MGLFDLKRKAKGNTNLSFTINQSGEWVYDNGSSAYINSGYKALPNVYSIISLILSKTTIVPFEIYTVKNKQKYKKYKASIANAKEVRDYTRTIQLKNESLEKIENSELEELLLNPNDYQSMEQLNWEIDGYKLLTGNSILYGIGMNEGAKPSELHNIPSPLIDLVVKGTPFAPEFEYKVSYLRNPLSGDDICHFKYWNPISDNSTPGQQYWGISPLKSCENLLGRYKDADITQGFQFKNMGPGGMITGASSNLEANLTEEQAVAVQDRFDQQHKGTYKAGSIMVTPSNLKWSAFGLSPVDLNIAKGKEEMAVELSNVYHVPISMISQANSTENNMIEGRKALITDAVIPIVEARKSVYQRKLLPKFGDNLVIEYDYTIFSELQEDLEKLSKTAAAMWWITPNERRAMTNYDQKKDPLMNRIYTPTGLIPLEDLGMNMEDVDSEFLDPES
jgi:HK97 family phage portal protein